jgi:signal transduction histidine kinase
LRDYLRRRFAGATALGAFLVANVALSAWLGYQALASAASHRRTVESVLTDYALTSATEFADDVEDGLDEVLDDVFEDMLERVGEGGRGRGAGPQDPPRTEGSWREPLTSESVREVMEEAMQDQDCLCLAFASPLVFLRHDPATRETEVLPDTLSPAIRERLVQWVALHRPIGNRRTEVGMITSKAGDLLDQPVAVGYMVRIDGSGAPLGEAAFVVSAEAMGELFRVWYDDAELIPEAIVGEQPNDSLLYVTVTDPQGSTFFASSVGYESTAPANAPIGPQFANLTVQAAVRQDAASLLIIGGLPNSRLLPLTLMLALTLGVGVASFIQLRREQSFQRLRDDFVSGVSHELRTPLAQIRMFAELQETGKLRSEDDNRRATSVIHRESRRLSHLVENILQFSRLQRTHGEGMPREELDVSEALAEGLDAVTPLLEDRGVKLEVEAQAGLSVYANREALTRIIVNLVDNAVKYGPRGQTVRVGVERVNGSAMLSVADQGPGVPAADRDKVWKPYHRLERDVKAAVTGTGIGLSVVSQLASLHEGRAWVEEASGGGARFVVELPLSDPSDPPTGHAA